MDSFRIIIPAYNEAKRILPTLEAYCSFFGERAAITVVTNGCTDGTADVVRGAMKRFSNLSILDIPAAIGKGGAVRCGLMLGDEPYVGFVDADLSFAPEEFEKLLRVCDEDDVDCAIGSRWNDEAGVVSRDRSRAIASMVFQAIRASLFRLSFKDTQCGIKLFRREAVNEILDDLELANLAFDVDLLLQFKHRGASIVEVPVRWQDVDGTKVRLLKSASSMFVAMIRLRLRRSIFGNLPYLDLISRQSVIPVARRLSILIVRSNTNVRSVDCDALIDRWRREGIQICERQCDGLFGPLRALFWYTFVSNRKFDAIVEMPRARSILPMVSVKPSFVVDDGQSRRVDRFWDACYSFRPLTQMTIDQSDALFQGVYSRAVYSSIYAARFLVFANTPALVYANGETGTHVEQPLLAEAS